MFARLTLLLLGQKVLKAQVMQYPRIELLFKGPVFRGSGIHIQQDSLFTSRAGHDLPPDGVEPQGGQVLQELVSVSIVKNTAVVLIGELAGNVGIAGDRQGGVVEAETALIKIRGNGVVLKILDK